MTLQWNSTSSAGSVWRSRFAFTNKDDGTRIDLTGLTWEFVVRRSPTETGQPLISVTTTPGAQGSIVVDLATSTLTVTLTPAATGPLGKGDYWLALWSDPTDTSGRLCWVNGIFTSALVSLP